VDSGFQLDANRVLIGADNAEGYSFRWEYSGGFGGSLLSGTNVIAAALEDNGVLTAFDMQILATPVPEPATVIVVCLSLFGIEGLRGRRS
jgi:hypothetical protein